MRRLIITLTMLLSVMAASGRDFQISTPDTLSVEKDESKQARKDSLCQYVRPIVRGKEIKTVEFGAKCNNIQIDGISFIEKLSFNAFSERKHA